MELSHQPEIDWSILPNASQCEHWRDICKRTPTVLVNDKDIFCECVNFLRLKRDQLRKMPLQGFRCESENS